MIEWKEDTIYVDVSEPDYIKLAEKLRKDTEKNVETIRLSYGDVCYAGKLAIERKTSIDFRASIFDNRLWDQLSGLSQYPNSCLVIIGSLVDGLEYRKNPQQILSSTLGALARVTAKYRVSVLMLENESQYYYVIKQMINGYDTHGSRPVMFSKKERTTKETRLDMLTALDGVSYNKAEKILDHFGGSLRAVVLSDEKQLKEVEGIGKGISRAMVEAFR